VRALETKKPLEREAVGKPARRRRGRSLPLAKEVAHDRQV
jgi:hypothetical protein